MPIGSRESAGRRGGSSATTLVLLFLALATVFLFGGSRGEPVYGIPGGYHGELTRDHIVVALNMSPEHGFLGFLQLTRTGDSDLVYRPYNRFPVLGYALIKLVTLPFPNDHSARETAARTLMLALFAAAGGEASGSAEKSRWLPSPAPGTNAVTRAPRAQVAEEVRAL